MWNITIITSATLVTIVHTWKEDQYTLSDSREYPKETNTFQPLNMTTQSINKCKHVTRNNNKHCNKLIELIFVISKKHSHQ